MKKSICIAGILLVAAMSCTKKASTVTVNDTPPDSMAVELYRGSFSNGPSGTTSGMAAIYESHGKWQLRLENFMVNNGPDLKVYLSKEQQPIHFIKLGDLKSTNGNQTYDISGMPDIMEYKYALIHCEQYNHLFGYTILVKQ